MKATTKAKAVVKAAKVTKAMTVSMAAVAMKTMKVMKVTTNKFVTAKSIRICFPQREPQTRRKTEEEARLIWRSHCNMKPVARPSTRAWEKSLAPPPSSACVESAGPHPAALTRKT